MASAQIASRFTVLLVDEESSLRRVTRAALTASGFAVEEAGTGAEAVAAIRQKQFDIVLLDVNMRGINSVDTCRQIRHLAPQTGIIMATVRDGEDDKVRGLDAGADDYVTKPFHLRELVARLGAVLRRTHRFTEATRVLQVGDLQLDLHRRFLMKREKKIRLSPKEFDLLALMMQNNGVPITHAKLLRTVWGPEYGGEVEYLRNYIRMLRKKIEDDPATPEYISTEAWVGYRFAAASGAGLLKGSLS